eukprot:TRINITY_DN6701_c0_g1_i2.p1 TRINITY_DN6701_c0_g1~~TRINITY_DN6701_c0_g1_i2.p1  ORF type:complete len:706 (-),score=202.73 TRINITY_DN6701_c0_g1_i2:68-2185(-)
MLLPKMIRTRLPIAVIGFYLHIPFPSSELYKVLPVRQDLLEGTLASDLVGFQTYDYARHFTKACTRILGTETSARCIHYKDREVTIDVFPVGVPVDKFQETMKDSVVRARIAELRKTFAGKQVLIGVDRLDYIKGIPHKLRGYEMFLKNNPEFRDKVVLVQIAVPSRMEVEEYKNQKKEVDILVGQINSEYSSSVGYIQPIHYLYKSVTFTELVALYAVANACIITSLRDGMNLVAHEYIATQASILQEDADTNTTTSRGGGVLILSEFAGVANMLAGAIRINPHNTKEVSRAIYESLTMKKDERLTKAQTNYTIISQHTASDWGRSFIDALRKEFFAAQIRRSTGSITIPAVLRSYGNQKKNAGEEGGGGKRLLVFEYDGVLVPFKSLPQMASPTEDVTDVLKKLLDDPLNLVVIFSGRKKQSLEEWFGSLPQERLVLCAEHGFFYKRGNSGWVQIEDEPDLSWMEQIGNVLEYIRERTPGSTVEKKETNLTFHYRGAEEYGAYQARHLQLHLDNLYGKFQVELGNKTIEVRPHSATLSRVVARIIKDLSEGSGTKVGLVLHIGASTNFDRQRLGEAGVEGAGENGGLDVISLASGKEANVQQHFTNTAAVIDFLNSLVLTNEMDVGEIIRGTSERKLIREEKEKKKDGGGEKEKVGWAVSSTTASTTGVGAKGTAKTSAGKSGLEKGSTADSNIEERLQKDKA